MLRPREICERLSVSYSTLRRWIEAGYVKAIRTVGGKYRIPENEIKRILESRVKEIRAVVYTRVSSHNQRKDFERQVGYLLEYSASKGYRVVETVTDIGSGLKTDRKRLKKLFNPVISKQVEVVVTYRDRLTKFGFEYLEYFFNQRGARIEVISCKEPRDAYQELVGDLIEIITSFTGKLYGMRSRRMKKMVEGFNKLIEEM